MSMPSPSATREPERRAGSLRPIRLSTFLLLTLVAGLLIAIYVAAHPRSQTPGCDLDLQESANGGDPRRPRPADRPGL